MHILCPHCHNPIEVVKLSAHEEIACPSCGSSFRLEMDTTTAPENGTLQKLGRFELLGVLGQGAFGTVYKARDPELDRTVAVKLPRAGNLAGPQELDRFLREARSAAQLRHPSIVPVPEVGQRDGLPYLVSDFVPGVTLADQLSARQPGFREAAELVAAVADALQYAHEQGVVHRDVKPSNIMIGGDGRPCVMDFGLARRDAGEITMTVECQVLGTPAYMSPEQARGEGHAVDGRGDVYSLGVVLYQLRTGELPFRGTQRMLLHQVLNDEPRSPSGLNDRIPRDLETVCLKAMAKEPARRYQTARDFADDLRRWLKGEPIQARPPSAWDRARKFVQRNRPLVIGTLATVAALLLGVAGTTLALLQARAETRRANETAQREADEAERANEALERLAEAERKRRAELPRRQAIAARLAAQRGLWREALGHYRQALDLGAENEVELRLGALACHAALYDFKAYRQELARVVALRDLGRHRGLVRLHQGLAEFFGSDKAADPIKAFREALALGLPPAEESYARGVLAETVPQMTDHLRAAIRHDPFHVRAHDLLITALLIQGRSDEAREMMARFELLAPSSVNGTTYRILDRAFAGDLTAALRKCDELRPQLGEE